MSHSIQYDREKEQLIDIPDRPDDNIVAQRVTVRYDNANNKVRVRKKQLFDKLNSHKLTYVKGGICDSYIKYGYPSLDKVISDVQNLTDQEDQRLAKLLSHLKKRGLRYDSDVSYYREYIEQGTDLKTAIREGKREWFLLNRTPYSKYLEELRDEDRAEELAIDHYVRKHGYTRQLKKYTGIIKEFEMKIKLY